MNKSLVYLVYVILFVVASCQTEDSIAPGKGRVAFSLENTGRGNEGRTSSVETPAFALLSIEDSDGNLQQGIKLPLFAFGQSYLSENLELPAGNFKLTQFLILDSEGDIIYAAPTKESRLAKYVTNPVPLDFTISKNSGTQIVPQVLQVFPQDEPGDFGYASFGFEVVSGDSVVLVKTDVKILVGDVLYENLNARLRAKGYDAQNNLKWTANYDYNGPTDIIRVKNGFDHYSLELVDKWGVNDVQADIPARDLWEGRADGAHPTTFGLAGIRDAKKLSKTISYRENKVENGFQYETESRTLYSYFSDGKLESIRREMYNPTTKQFDPMTKDIFVYEGSQLLKIITTMGNELYSDLSYTYGTENTISGTLYFNRDMKQTVKWKVDEGSSVLANYSFSNGQSFSYGFDILHKNIVSDETIKEGRVCNDGFYTYDKNINPFHHLGYVDFSLTNWSASNKLTENVTHRACSFPQLMPESYDYIYDNDGYPTQQITTYKRNNGGSANGHMRTEFFY